MEGHEEHCFGGGKSLDLSQVTGVRVPAPPFTSVCLRASPLNSLNFSFLIFQVGKIILALSSLC